MDKPFNEKVQQFKKFKEEQREYLEALKEGSSAKEKAEVEKMGKPEPKAKPFPYHLTAEAKAAKDAKAARSQEGGSSGSGQRARSPLPRLPIPEAVVRSGLHWTEQDSDGRRKLERYQEASQG